jgi:Na+/H+ antiporter NhaC
MTMNRTQKYAWFSLAIFSLSIAVAGYNFYGVFVSKKLADSFIGRYWSVFAFSLILIPALILLRKKQSPAEVDSDERDEQIRKKAIVASYTSAVILFIISILILWFAVGPNGTIPVWIFPLIVLEVFFMAMVVYSIAILIQYGRAGKENEKSGQNVVSEPHFSKG